MAADLADQAQQLEEMERDAAIERHRAMNRPGETADDCIECGLQIPSERQAALPGVQTCVECAETLEKQARHFRRA